MKINFNYETAQYMKTSFANSQIDDGWFSNTWIIKYSRSLVREMASIFEGSDLVKSGLRKCLEVRAWEFWHKDVFKYMEKVSFFWKLEYFSGKFLNI